MVITIRDVLGPKWYEKKLYDNNSLKTGGLSKAEETLGDFIKDTDIDADKDDVSKIQRELRICGLREIMEIDDYVQELIEKRLEDIEDEFGIDIEYTWDYIY